MSENQVIDQLGEYGSWLQSEMGLLLSPALHAEIFVGEDEDFGGAPKTEAGRTVEFGPNRKRVWLGVAAALVILVVGLALLNLVSIGEDSSLDPADPDSIELPYVLPPAGYEMFTMVGFGQLLENGASDYLARTTLVGVFDGTAYSHRISLTVVNSVPSVFDGRIAEQRGDVWLVLSAADDADLPEQLLAATEIDADGFASLPSQYGYVVIAKFLEGPSLRATNTFYMPIDEDSSSSGAWVETASEHPLVNAEFRVGDLTQIQVRGAKGWSLYVPGLRDYTDYYWVAWETASGGMVSVSTRGDYDGLLSFAEALSIVDEEAWLAEHPGRPEDKFGPKSSSSRGRMQMLRAFQMSLIDTSLCDILRESFTRGKADPELGLPSFVPMSDQEIVGSRWGCSSSPNAPPKIVIAWVFPQGLLVFTNLPGLRPVDVENVINGLDFTLEDLSQVMEGVYIAGDIGETGELVDPGVLYQQTQTP